MANYPKKWNKWYREIGRELYCFFLGHTWKSSQRRRRDFDIVSKLSLAQYRQLVPYARRKTLEPLREYSAGWKYKCRRCRTRIRNEKWNPWWKELYYAVYFGIRAVEFEFTFCKANKSNLKFPWVLCFLVTFPVRSASDFYLNLASDWNLPWFPVNWTMELIDLIYSVTWKNDNGK